MYPLLNLLLICSLFAVTFVLSKTHGQRSLQQFEVIRLGFYPYAVFQQFRLYPFAVAPNSSTKVPCIVIRLGLEPKTPTLKVLCSTC